MKKLFYLGVLLISCSIFAQEKKVYKYTNGIRDLAPSNTIVEKGDKTYIYGHDENGLKDLFPDKIVGGNKVYNVDENGLKEMFPEYVIEE